jgi:histidine triad (HIT) family protein
MLPNTNTANSDCLFCKIVSGQIPSTKIYEDAELIAFNDIHPAMPVHFLIVPKQHIAMLSNCDIHNNAHIQLLGKMLALAPILAAQQGCNNGFKTIIHNDKGGGQEIFHLHLHVMGKPL